MSELVNCNLKLDPETARRLEALMAEEYRSKTDTVSMLINLRYLQKHPEEANIPVQEELDRM